jgi:hypothetical protein
MCLEYYYCISKSLCTLFDWQLSSASRIHRTMFVARQVCTEFYKWHAWSPYQSAMFRWVDCLRCSWIQHLKSIEQPLWIPISYTCTSRLIMLTCHWSHPGKRYSNLNWWLSVWAVRVRSGIWPGSLYSWAGAPQTQVHRSPQHTKALDLTQPKRLV